MKRVALITNKNYTVKHFRNNFINYLRDLKYDISIIIIDDIDEKLSIEGTKIYYVKGNNRSINPFSKIYLKEEIKKQLRITNPDFVFTYQLTPNTFGVEACIECGIKKVYPMIEGLGDIVINDSFKWKIIRSISFNLLKKTLSYSKKVFFINVDDKNFLVKRNIVNEDKCIVIPGVGVDVDYFSYKPLINDNVFLMASRLSKTKGVFEYCEAARILKQKYKDIRFNLIGEEFTIKADDIKQYINDGSINYFGYCDEIRKAYWGCSVNVLPSYREGFGLTIAESGACGRPSIASNVEGCKDAVINNKTGLLFENRNVNDLVKKMEFFIINKDKIKEMGDEARKLAATKFNKDYVNKMVLDEVNDCE